MDKELNSVNMTDEDHISLGDYAEQAYLDYAVSVVKGRALPELSDGQKPVQRRILYAMNDMGLVSGSKPVKSARVVGDVLGKYHPHGDQAAYDAMVRMAQDFVLRYPLIDGQGNFGSQDGDGAAAMRYTEARLTPIASLLLDEIKEGTVDFIDNYDGSQKEPSLLPSRLPFVMLNGASGIAVGMATEIPSHNMGEIAQGCIEILKRPSMTQDDLMQIVQGPDFAGGAQIITSLEDIAQVYRTGKGSVRVRAKWHIEPLARGQWQLVVTELPPNTSSRKILETIEDLANPKVKSGKKKLTQEQQQQKALVLSMLDTVRDEADRNSPVRLVFEPKSSRVDKDEFLTMLLAKTGLEANVSINLVCIGTDGRPAQKDLLTILKEWNAHRLHVLTRRSQFRLDKINDRLHILEGRQIVYLNIEEVITCIRESDEPKQDLMSRFSLTERQAEDILEIRLRQLAKLEGFKIEQEIQEKQALRDELMLLLGDESRMKSLMIQEIKADVKKFGDERRTLIQEEERAVQEQKVVDEEVTVIVSKKGWLRQRQGHHPEMDNLTFKAGDELGSLFCCRSVDDILVFDPEGRVYTIAVHGLPSVRAEGVPMSSLVELQSQPFSHVIADAPDTTYLFAKTSGLGFVAKYEKIKTRQKAGKHFIDLQDGATLLPPLRITSDTKHVALLTKNKRLLIISVSELKRLNNGGLGTILINLDEDDVLEQVIPVTQEGMRISGIYRRKSVDQVLSLEELTPYIGKRARKGKTFSTKVKQPTLFGF